MTQGDCRRSLAPLLLICASVAGGAFGHAQAQQADLPAVVRGAGRAVVSIRVYDATGRSLAFGSGFLVEGGRVVTNTHVVEGASRVEVFDSDGQLLGTTQYAESLSTTVDLAILPRMGAVPGSIALSASLPSVGERIIVIGAPEGLTNTVSDGIVSAFRNSEGRRWMQITAPISSGSSGGPVLNSQGEVVGVSVAMLRQGQNLNFAIPVSDVRAMLTSPAGRVAFPSVSAPATAATTSSESAEEFRTISVGQTARGILESTDIRLDDGGHMDGYTFSARRGQTVTVTLQSSDFDAYAEVYLSVGDEVKLVGQDDDSGGGTNSRLVITIPQDGQYLIGVSSAEPEELGRYTISLTAGGSRQAATPTPSPSAGESTERWIRAGTAPTFTDDIDQTRIVPQGGGVYRAWIRRTYNSPQTISDGLRYDVRIEQKDYNCLRRQTRIISTHVYLGSEVVYTDPSSSAPGPWRDWVPDSVGETIGNTVCEFARRQGI